jgi:hypothetical protein
MLLIDAANVIGSRPTGWWRDRPKAARELAVRVREAAAEGTLPIPVVLVLEGQAKQGVDEGITQDVEVVHAPGHGDETMVTLMAQSDQPVLLVTADRELGERGRRHGAEVVRPSWLLDRLSSSG